MISIPRRFKRARPFLPVVRRRRRPRARWRDPDAVSFDSLIATTAPLYRHLARLERRLDDLAFAARDRADRQDDAVKGLGLRVTRKPGA